MVTDHGAAQAVADFFMAASPSNVELVNHGDWLKVTMPAAAAERAFETTFHAYRVVANEASSTTAPTVVHRALSYSLPTHIAAAVDFVASVVSFPVQRAPVRTFAAAAGDLATVYPALLSKVYNIDSNVVASPLATQAVYETNQQWFNASDLQQFLRDKGVDGGSVTPTVVGRNDRPDQCADQACAETALDLEYIMAVAQQAPTAFWYADSADYGAFLARVSADANPPLVMSISYGGEEHGFDAAFPGSTQRFNTEAQKLGARGVTLLASSGDDGVAGPNARPSRQGAAACNAPFVAQFPAASPFVTVVGATQGPEAGNAEVACTARAGSGAIITSGGGFSALFARPKYQSAAVAAYLQSGVALPPAKKYNAKGRAYPDVALLGNAYEVVSGAQNQIQSGTSASTPVFAAMLTLINGARLAAGKRSVGFVNPALYGAGAGVFRDVTQGDNKCSWFENGASTCCPTGFEAAPGWDPTTGLGSVDFVALKAYFMSLP